MEGTDEWTEGTETVNEEGVRETATCRGKPQEVTGADSTGKGPQARKNREANWSREETKQPQKPREPQNAAMKLEGQRRQNLIRLLLLWRHQAMCSSLPPIDRYFLEYFLLSILELLSLYCITLTIGWSLIVIADMNYFYIKYYPITISRCGPYRLLTLPLPFSYYVKFFCARKKKNSY